jgi:hypothetical protein
MTGFAMESAAAGLQNLCRLAPSLPHRFLTRRSPVASNDLRQFFAFYFYGSDEVSTRNS